MRHKSRMPIGEPVSMSDLSCYRDETGLCEYYVQDDDAVKLNLNTATEEELLELGLSKNRVAKIMAARETRGGFRSVADLLKVRSIGRETYEKVCRKLYVEEPKPEPLVDEQQREWMLRISDATAWISDFLNKTFPRTWCKLRFEHVDAAAYWFTFELVNDDRRQTWCVRHSDLIGARDKIHRLMRGRKEEDMCGTCEYNLKMLREHHIMYLPDTCPRRSSGECPEDNGEVAAAEDDEELKMYIEYRDGEPHSYLYGPSWKAMQLFMEGGYKTPEEAKAAWLREQEEL